MLSDVLCANESVIHWCILGGDWMKIGLPMHVVDIDWKPESGCESQSARCGKYGATMQLHIVKSKLCCQREANGAVDENERT